MVMETPTIQPLPADVVSRITSSTTIRNLNDVILELLKNSLDAGACTVTISVDFQRAACNVEDDGCGIPSIEFRDGGGLGKQHHTSKIHESNHIYGHKDFQSTNSLVFHHSKPIARLCPAPLRHELQYPQHGTKVTVNDLFGNLPVRVKHRALALRRNEDIDREWEDLKKVVAGLLIAFQRPIKVILSDVSRSRKLIFRGQNRAPLDFKRDLNDDVPTTIDMDRLRAILSQAGYIIPREFSSWVSVSARTSDISVKAAISLQPSPTKHAQFISFGINPVYSQGDANVLFNEINEIFSASSFGVEESSPRVACGIEKLSLTDNQKAPDELVNKRQRSRAKGVNRWPMFYVRIVPNQDNSIYDPKVDPTNRGVSIQKVIDVVAAICRQFLEQYHLSPQSKAKPKRSRSVSPVLSESPENGTKRARRLHPPEINESFLRQDERGLDTPGIKLSSLATSGRKSSYKGFGGWSRIKSGKRDVYAELCSGLPRGGTRPSLSNRKQGASLVYPQETLRPSSATSAPNIMQSKNCQNIHDSQLLRVQSETPTVLGDSVQQVSAAERQSLIDEVASWTDPLTKDLILINKRTGQTLPSNNVPYISSQRSSHSILRPRTTDCLRSLKPGECKLLQSEPTQWLDSFLDGWENPVFRQPDRPVPSTAPRIFSNGGRHSVEEKFFQHFSSFGFHNDILNGTLKNFEGRLRKSELRDARVVAQVDNKFLLVKMAARRSHSHEPEEILVLVDQHAADERCRVEQLFESLCGLSSSHIVETTTLASPISFNVSTREAGLFEARSGYFASWGCHFEVSREKQGQCIVSVTRLPILIAERCRIEPKLPIDMLRSELWDRTDNSRSSTRLRSQDPRLYEDNNNSRSPDSHPKSDIDEQSLDGSFWLQCITECPKKIIDLLNSRACRSAIMFNDPLSMPECRKLMSRLSRCAFPFQCAHGRPSMVPVMNLGPLPTIVTTETISGLESSLDRLPRLANKGTKETEKKLSFIEAYNSWQHELT